MKLRTILFFSITIFLFGCNRQIDRGIDPVNGGADPVNGEINPMNRGYPMNEGIYPGNNSGTAWARGSFDSNGERIYFTSTSDRGTPITYTGGVGMGMMMMGGRMACVSCHGTDARGGDQEMYMEMMNAPDIRWSALSRDHHEEEGDGDGHDSHKGYDFEDFRNAVEYGRHPDGKELSIYMPRWQMSDADLRDLMNYLKSL